MCVLYFKWKIIYFFSPPLRNQPDLTYSLLNFPNLQHIIHISDSGDFKEKLDEHGGNGGAESARNLSSRHCDICGKEFSREADVIQHITSVHLKIREFKTLLTNHISTITKNMSILRSKNSNVISATNNLLRNHISTITRNLFVLRSRSLDVMSSTNNTTWI